MAQPAEAVPAPLPEPNEASALEEVHEPADTVLTPRNHGRPPKAAGPRGRRGHPRGARELRDPRGRVAIVDGCRTPFIKSGTSFRDMAVIDLAGVATAELVTRT